MRHKLLSLLLFVLGGFVYLIPSASVFASPIDLDAIVSILKPEKEVQTGANLPDSAGDLKDVLKNGDLEADSGAEKEKEKQQLTQNLNRLLIETYKGKVDVIFGNLQKNIENYPPEVQIRIFKQIGNSIAAKMALLEQK